MINFEQLLEGAHRVKASDIHLVPENRPTLRVNGDLRQVSGPILSGDDIEQMVNRIIPSWQKDRLEKNRGADFWYRLRDIARYRCVAYYVQNSLGLTMRCIPMQIPTLDDLKMPESLKGIAVLHRGLTLLTGQTGCGKTTTLAAMINHVNVSEARRVVTIEDPVEFLIKPVKCLVSQREVGLDVPDFSQGLRQAMRMDPDTILIGEMRDAETIRVAIKAAETGHMVFSTLHTTGAVHTIQRIIGHFDESEHNLLREQLALNMNASITQRLVKTVGGRGRRAALEIMRLNATVGKLIHDNRIPDIFSVIRSRVDGMQVMDQALADLINDEAITFEEATNYCDDYYALKRYVDGVGASGDAGAILAG